MEYQWGHIRRFNAYSNYFKKVFGERIQKVTINAGFTCPNRDGSKGTGGCTFCNNESFNPSYCVPEKTVEQQINEGIDFHKVRYRRSSKYLAYFQAFSNTYADIDILKSVYKPAIDHPDVLGIVIGTRPDCIDDEKLDYFKQLAEDKYLIIEYGIESVYDKTLKRINRGHDYKTSIDAVERTAAKGIKVGAHMIFGLPGESRDDMMNSAQILSELPLNNIKFHQLQIVKDTQMSLDYTNNPDEYKFFDMEEYIEFFVDYAERLNPNFVIERFAGEVPPKFNLRPSWGMRNDQLVNLFEKRLKERETWQGRLYNSK